MRRSPRLMCTILVVPHRTGKDFGPTALGGAGEERGDGDSERGRHGTFASVTRRHRGRKLHDHNANTQRSTPQPRR